MKLFLLSFLFFTGSNAIAMCAVSTEKNLTRGEFEVASIEIPSTIQCAIKIKETYRDSQRKVPGCFLKLKRVRGKAPEGEDQSPSYTAYSEGKNCDFKAGLNVMLDLLQTCCPEMLTLCSEMKSENYACLKDSWVTVDDYDKLFSEIKERKAQNERMEKESQKKSKP